MPCKKTLQRNNWPKSSKPTNQPTIIHSKNSNTNTGGSFLGVSAWSARKDVTKRRIIFGLKNKTWQRTSIQLFDGPDEFLDDFCKSVRTACRRLWFYRLWHIYTRRKTKENHRNDYCKLTNVKQCGGFGICWRRKVGLLFVLFLYSIFSKSLTRSRISRLLVSSISPANINSSNIL